MVFLIQFGINLHVSAFKMLKLHQVLQQVHFHLLGKLNLMRKTV